MGLLKVGQPLSWDDSKPHLKYVREHGILQFLVTYDQLRNLVKPELKWGEELEYQLFKVDPKARTVKCSLRGPELRNHLQEKEIEYEERFEGCTWHPEWGRWMIESTPNRPYSGYAHDLLRVETNMRLRRTRLLHALQPDEIAPSVTAFPLLGVGTFTDPPYPPGGLVTLSDSIPDACIHPHPRFAALVANIRSRRGSKVDIRAPLFEDRYTPEFRRSGMSQAGKSAQDRLPDEDGYVWQMDGEGNDGGRKQEAGQGKCACQAHMANGMGEDKDSTPGKGRPVVTMDCMAYGMGCCCLQVTFQARDVSESRYMYDQLAVLAPIMLALTASTPILKGRLVDTDVRWQYIAASVDCRTPAERGELGSDLRELNKHADDRMAGRGIRRLRKSRYDGISCYIYSCRAAARRASELAQRSDSAETCDVPPGMSPSEPFWLRRTSSMQRGVGGDDVLMAYNDVEVEVDEELEQMLKDGGIDPFLAKHVAHLFIRDPLVIFNGSIQEVDDKTHSDHFENLQSTNWNSVRWKPPPPSQSLTEPRIGWRTEFRSMEIQLTDYENAAFTVFVVLLTRIILAFDLHLYIPISRLDENMQRAHTRGSVVEEKFWFRKSMADIDGDDAFYGADRLAPGVPHLAHCHCTEVQDYEEMTIAEIMTGKGAYFPGLIPLCYAYLDHIQVDREIRNKVGNYLELIRRRATGELMTTAAWMRAYVDKHPEYKHNSVISQGIAYDLMMECKAIGEGRKTCPELLGKGVVIEPICQQEAYDTPLTSNRLVSSERAKVIQRYLRRTSFLRRHHTDDSGADPSDYSSSSSFTATTPHSLFSPLTPASTR